MIGTLLVLTHFVLRKLGLTNCELPPGWPAYVCGTHEGGARTTTASVTSGVSVPAVAATSLPANTATAPPPPAAAASVATQGLAKPSVHPIQSMVQAQLEPLATAIPQPPPCITIANPPYPGSPCPCPTSKYPPYEPADQKMPFVIDNTAPAPAAFGPRAGLSMAQASAPAAAGAPGPDAGYTLQDKKPLDNCVTITASGVSVPCTPPGGKKPGMGASKVIPASVAGGKSTLNQQPATSPSKAAPPK